MPQNTDDMIHTDCRNEIRREEQRYEAAVERAESRRAELDRKAIKARLAKVTKSTGTDYEEKIVKEIIDWQNTYCDCDCAVEIELADNLVVEVTAVVESTSRYDASCNAYDIRVYRCNVEIEGAIRYNDDGEAQEVDVAALGIDTAYIERELTDYYESAY